MHLNTDIFTQVVSLKLKNRENRLYRVLKASLRKVYVPRISRVNERKSKPDKNQVFINKIRNNYINNMFTNYDKDPLNNLLLDLFPSIYNLEITKKKRRYTRNYSLSLTKYILNTLKQLRLRGIRIEAKGRLTKRLTASRSIFKVRWKGGLKNVDSSFRGISATMLRGFVKPNIAYSLINSKNRNGAFGFRAWTSTK
uniref:Ribosomal protein S3 n=1 Tax=Cairneyella variabilis TaxID=1802957 RepID=A0A140D7Y4_9HELO|nr:ribosomal protein S3 [Cairneyella variabilis]AMK09008.1 ribosomal protein S3 [Cairneyella variabilis]